MLTPFLALITPLTGDVTPPTPGQPTIPQFPIWGPPGITLPPGPGYPPVAGHPLPPIPPGGGGPGIPSYPQFPIWGPPGMELPDRPGYPPVAGHPLPPIPPGGGPWIEVPPPGTVTVPPGNRPVQPIAIPEYIIVFYPGVGYVLVGRPVTDGDSSSSSGSSSAEASSTKSSSKHIK